MVQDPAEDTYAPGGVDRGRETWQLRGRDGQECALYHPGADGQHLGEARARPLHTQPRRIRVRAPAFDIQDIVSV